MEDLTLNLLGELGVTDQRRLRHAPAITLHPDGTLTLWADWSYSQMNPKELQRRKQNERLENWKTSYAVVDLKSVRKVRYFEKKWTHSCGRISFEDAEYSVDFYRALHRDTRPYFGVDPLWLAVPRFREFLTKHVHAEIRNDFDPQRGWLLRRREVLDLFDKTARTLKSTSSVSSERGVITWEHDSGLAHVQVFGPRRAPVSHYLLTSQGDLSRL